MRTIRYLAAVLVAAFSIATSAQNSNFGVANQYISTTVGKLGTATAGNKNTVRRVTDPLTATDCTTGGGSYTTTIVLCVSSGTAWVAAGGGGGITNGAGANVIPKSDGTNLVASSFTDNGTTATTTDNVQLPSAGTLNFSTDTGISRDSAGVLDVGTGAAASTAGTIQAASFAAKGTTAGVIDFAQGSTNAAASPCTTATSICEQAPAAVTSYLITKPGVSAQGIISGTLSGTTITQGISGDTNHSTTVTIGSGTSIGSTSLCSTVFCPVGTYRVNVYVDITTACGTSGTYIVNLIYTDDQGSKTVVMNINGTGAVPATGTLTTTSTANFGEESQIIRSTGAASINYSTTATACGTAGPMVGKLYLSIEPIQ